MFQKAVVVASVGLVGIGGFSAIGTSSELAIRGATNARPTAAVGIQPAPQIGSRLEAAFGSFARAGRITQVGKIAKVADDLTEAAKIVSGVKLRRGARVIVPEVVVNGETVKGASLVLKRKKISLVDANFEVLAEVANDQPSLRAWARHIEQPSSTTQVKTRDGVNRVSLFSETFNDSAIATQWTKDGRLIDEDLVSKVNRGTLELIVQARRRYKDGNFIEGLFYPNGLERILPRDWLIEQGFYKPGRGATPEFALQLDGMTAALNGKGDHARSLVNLFLDSRAVHYFPDGTVSFSDFTGARRSSFLAGSPPTDVLGNTLALETFKGKFVVEATIESDIVRVPANPRGSELLKQVRDGGAEIRSLDDGSIQVQSALDAHEYISRTARPDGTLEEIRETALPLEEAGRLVRVYNVNDSTRSIKIEGVGLNGQFNGTAGTKGFEAFTFGPARPGIGIGHRGLDQPVVIDTFPRGFSDAEAFQRFLRESRSVEISPVDGSVTVTAADGTVSTFKASPQR